MHVLYSGRLTWIMLGAGLFWLAILMSLTLADYLTRHWLAYSSEDLARPTRR